MTATSAGSSGSSCLPAKGLDISLAALQRQDPYINNIVDVASQVALYTYNNRANELASPRHGFTIMNRLSMENLTEPITKDLDFQLQHPFLLYRNARLVIHGIWFYDKEDCQRIAQRMKILTQQEQALAQSQGGWLSPGGVGGGIVGGGIVEGDKVVVVGGGGGGTGGGGGGGGGEAKGVDIIQMLTKARTEYDKGQSTSEPKEIGGSSVLCGNPNLIKPIPVKPNTQDSDGAEPKPLSLATLFGSQHQHHQSSKPDPLSPVAAPVTGLSTGKVTRPPVARTLTYEETVNSGRSGTSQGGLGGVIGGQTVKEGGALGLLLSPTTAQQQQNQPQHCPAIQKLMQGQRGVVGVGGVLQTLSESPENRLCDNGVPLEHHHHHHLFHHHQPHHHHHHHHQQQQLQPDPIKRLFQTQPPPPSVTSFTTAATLCCSSAPALQQSPHLSSQPVVVDSVSCAHLQAQQSQQLFFSLSKTQAEAQLSSQSASTIQGTGLTSQMPGVVSPHELLQKLQLVQQEQSLTSHEPPRLCPGLAPRFLGPTQGQGAGSAPNQTVTTAGQKAAMQFQVISPQRIPATVAPNLLLSPSVFTQAMSSGGLSTVSQESRSAPSALSRHPLQDEIRGLSRSQFQATLLHLIQNDSSFLDTIYEAYVSRLAIDSSSKYIQAATSPKDVVIVVDVSGSMKGLRLTIAKHTINTILDTLGENDFVNVIAHFKLLVDELHVKGEGRVKNAMKESFKILNEAAAQGQGSLCNQAIMLITDGAMEDFQDVFEEFNWPERRLFNTQAQSLLLMTSVAMPVFSKKKETLSHGILLGVVGTDVALRELMRLAPRYKLGVHGYAYLITNNGYILSHPDLRPLYKEGKKLKPKPNYNSVDLSEVEWEDTEEKLRTAMVKGETGTLTLDVKTSVDKGRRVMFLKNDYFYTVINETPFSLGIVLTQGYGQYIFIGNVSVEEGLHDLEAPDLIIASEWTYCETDIDPDHRKLTQLEAVKRYLTGKDADLECDALLIEQTLFDAVVTAPMEAYWTALMLNTSGVDEGIETAFLGTRSGLMRFQRYTGIEKRTGK
ncbi:Voltage-dependent calcium channel subunit alpha-2/delta-4 [Collichthys lucidus]|uniref:5'-(N(7)-methylguanosine 5'-triphospho)-[mRNA] hydrolase n=1 Tax=Collichthys lucidus TaxID=240159 RepID=A0A4U5VQH4_COLLU|nr:Voltage-dependent calcium channel subunit alpha-2/delta-4 [Collichthys lucidus]